MKRITAVLKQGRKILSPYVPAGFPDPHHTVEILHALVAGGADILELGIPFSDPMAEGPVIQAALEKALAWNMTPRWVLNLVAEFRKTNTTTPVILMGYLNPILSYGYEAFAEDAAQAGVDGTIIVDLPPEEAQEWLQCAQAHDLAHIFLCSPTVSDERMRKMARVAQGYLYCVSLKGVTGSGALRTDDVNSLVQRQRQFFNLPILVGFGIKDGPAAAKIAQIADGVIVGAALVERLEKHQDKKDLLNAARLFMQELRTALDQ